MFKLVPAAAAAFVAVAMVQPGAGRWSEKAPLPTAMAEVGVAALGGKVYVLGGTAQGRVQFAAQRAIRPRHE